MIFEYVFNSKCYKISQLTKKRGCKASKEFKNGSLPGGRVFKRNRTILKVVQHPEISLVQKDPPLFKKKTINYWPKTLLDDKPGGGVQKWKNTTDCGATP